MFSSQVLNFLKTLLIKTIQEEDSGLGSSLRHLLHPLIERQSLLLRSLCIFKITLKVYQMPSLGKRMSQAHLKLQVRAQSKQKQTLVFPMPLSSLGCSAEAAVTAF